MWDLQMVAYASVWNVTETFWRHVCATRDLNVGHVWIPRRANQVISHECLVSWGVLFLQMEWPPIFRNDTCFMDDKMSIVPVNADGDNVVNCQLSSVCPDSSWWPLTLPGPIGFLLFTTWWFDSLETADGLPCTSAQKSYKYVSTAFRPH